MQHVHGAAQQRSEDVTAQAEKHDPEVFMTLHRGQAFCLQVVHPSLSCEHDILRTPEGKFFEFGTSRSLELKMNWFDFGGQRSKVEGRWPLEHDISGLPAWNIFKFDQFSFRNVSECPNTWVGKSLSGLQFALKSECETWSWSWNYGLLVMMSSPHKQNLCRFLTCLILFSQDNLTVRSLIQSSWWMSFWSLTPTNCPSPRPACASWSPLTSPPAPGSPWQDAWSSVRYVTHTSQVISTGALWPTRPALLSQRQRLIRTSKNQRDSEASAGSRGGSTNNSLKRTGSCTVENGGGRPGIGEAEVGDKPGAEVCQQEVEEEDDYGIFSPVRIPGEKDPNLS